MLASASQNIIVLCDNVFLYHKDLVDFGAIALVGVFYLIISSIGYGFSRGGQILIARRYGEKNFSLLGKTFQSLSFFQFALALLLFVFMQYGAEYFFSFFINSPLYLERAMDYLYPRSYGVFFSYIGLSLVALYTGIAHTKFIIIDTIIMTVTNVVLNYVLIFGAFGFESMGIEGAGIASTIAEIVAFVVFVIYLWYDRSNRKLQLFQKLKIDRVLLKNVYSISFPIVLQAAVGLGSWFLFFSMIEKYHGSRSLEVSNLIRNVYLMLSVPCWGFSAGINTLVSNFIGDKKRQAVLPLIYKTAKMCLICTLVVSVPIIFFPEIFLYPIFGKNDMSLLIEAKQVFPVLLMILVVFSVSAIYMNGLMGTGETPLVLRIQIAATFLYLIYIFLVIKVYTLDVKWAWATEIFYWLFIFGVTYYYLSRKRWHHKRV